MYAHDPASDRENAYLERVDDWNGRLVRAAAAGEAPVTLRGVDPDPGASCFHRCRTVQALRDCLAVANLVWRAVHDSRGGLFAVAGGLGLAYTLLPDLITHALGGTP